MKAVLSYLTELLKLSQKITCLRKGMQWKTCMVYGDSEIEDLLDEFCFEDKL